MASVRTASRIGVGSQHDGPESAYLAANAVGVFAWIPRYDPASQNERQWAARDRETAFFAREHLVVHYDG